MSRYLARIKQWMTVNTIAVETLKSSAPLALSNGPSDLHDEVGMMSP
jgi:hypothetical protein